MSYLVPLGVIFIVMVIFMPQGLLGFAKRWLNRYVPRRWHPRTPGSAAQ